MLTAACCLQVLTALAACSVVVTTGGVSAAAAASTVLAHACHESTLGAAAALAVALNTTVAVPNAAAADVALFAQDLTFMLPSCVCLFACPIASDIVAGCWCRGKGPPVRALHRFKSRLPSHERQSQAQARWACPSGAVAQKVIALGFEPVARRASKPLAEFVMDGLAEPMVERSQQHSVFGWTAESRRSKWQGRGLCM